MKLLSLVIATLMLTSCTSTKPKKIKVAKASTPNLTHEEAILRGQQVSNVHYRLYFDLSAKADSYHGQSEISFKAKLIHKNIRLDFFQGHVQEIYINEELVPAQYNQHFITLPKKYLKLGDNKVVVKFERKFSRDGSGLYRFIDNEDGKIYIYTDLEPFDANKVFPLFDQPDLKATYTMNVRTPADWQVSTSTLESSKVEDKETKTISWNFPKSQTFSTYIWALHAGPYHVFEDKSYKYPLRLFVRESLKEYIKVNDWFTFTKQSFEFMDNYFDYPYPYKKYDQLIVPDFNAGAMENVAAVTFSERFVNRGEKTQKERRRLANVIFHEMAHMWFGNLVTMKWWNDLWLNESFATYIANLGVSRYTEFKEEGWRDFNGTKQWAYWEDQLVTTHPIEAMVKDTTGAFANFDGITYGKGAASLKQLHYYLGDTGFKKGLQIYFKQYANKNTTLKDFMQALSEGAGVQLDNWQKAWLQTTGVNKIKVDYSCRKGKITQFNLKQIGTPFRPHAFEIAFVNFDLPTKSYKSKKEVKVKFATETHELKSVVGQRCPAMVYANYNDFAYSKVILDHKTLQFLRKSIHKVRPHFLRQLLWTALWDMTYYAELDYKLYTELLLEKGLEQEQDDIILRNNLRTVIGRHSNAPSVLFYSIHDSSVSTQEYLYLVSKFEERIWNLLQKSKPNSERQKVLFNAYVELIHSKDGMKRLENLLAGQESIEGVTIDQDKRWKMVKKLNSVNFPGSQDALVEEKKKDQSSFGKKMSIASSAIRPIQSEKIKWISEYKNKETKHSFAELKAAIYNLFPREQKKFRKEYSKQFFTDLRTINKKLDGMVAEKFTALAPNHCNEELLLIYDNYIEKNRSRLKENVLKDLLIARQENERCINVLKQTY